MLSTSWSFTEHFEILSFYTPAQAKYLDLIQATKSVCVAALL